MKADILALLEDGPKKLRQLCEWLDRLESAVKAELQELSADGRAHRTHDGQWAPGPAPRPARHGRPPLVDEGALVAFIRQRGAVTLETVRQSFPMKWSTCKDRLAQLRGCGLLIARRQQGRIYYSVPGADIRPNSLALTINLTLSQTPEAQAARRAAPVASTKRSRLRQPVEANFRNPAADVRMSARVDARFGITSTGHGLCLHCFGRFSPISDGDQFCSDRCRQAGPTRAPQRRTEVINGIEYEITSGNLARPWPEDLTSNSSIEENPSLRFSRMTSS